MLCYCTTQDSNGIPVGKFLLIGASKPLDRRAPKCYNPIRQAVSVKVFRAEIGPEPELRVSGPPVDTHAAPRTLCTLINHDLIATVSVPNDALGSATIFAERYRRHIQ